LRNRIVHDYLGLDTLKVFKIIREEVPELLNELYVNTQRRITDGQTDGTKTTEDYFGAPQ